MVVLFSMYWESIPIRTEKELGIFLVLAPFLAVTYNGRNFMSHRVGVNVDSQDKWPQQPSPLFY